MVKLPSGDPLEFAGDVEIKPSLQPPAEIRLVVFDFDGTLSWLRHGWPMIMVEVLRGHWPARADEPPEDVDSLLLSEILSLNGKSTIFQLIRFVELARQRGAEPPTAESLCDEYQRRLDAAIAERTARIRQAEARPDDYVVHAGRAVLEHLHRQGVHLAILSSTVEHRVREEAELLGIAPFFGDRICGGTGDPTQFSKRDVFQRLLDETGSAGENLLSFGDGPTEIVHTKELGGLAIAVCSDENENGSGRFDRHKKEQLLAAGADAAIPDYRDACTLVDYLLQP